MTQWLPLAAVVAYLGVALVLPTVITAVRHGQLAMTFHRETEPLQRAMGVGFGLLLAGIVVWALLVGLVGPADLGGWNLPAGAGLLGGVLAVAGTALTLLAQRQMGASWRVGIDDRPTALVTHGLYRWVRNPIFTGMLISLAGFVLACPSLVTVLGYAAVAAVISVQVRFEERHLEALHGRAWRDYASTAGRFLPSLGRLAFGKAETRQVEARGDRPMPSMAFLGMAAFFALRDLVVRPESVVRRAGVQPGERVVDFGCGPGAYALEAARVVGPTGSVLAQDIVPLAVERLEAKARRVGLRNLSVRCSGCETGLPTASVDRILALDVMHMLSDRVAVLRELNRVLRPGGQLVTTADHVEERTLLEDCAQAGFVLRERRGGMYVLGREENRV